MEPQQIQRPVRFSHCLFVARVELTTYVFKNKKRLPGLAIDTVMGEMLSFADTELPHRARVSLMSLLIVVLTEVPRESVIWNVIL